MQDSDNNSSRSSLVIPEIVLFNTLNSVLDFIREDFRKFSDERSTWLYKMFGSTKAGGYSFYEQAKRILIDADVDDPRLLEVRMFFDTERAHLPTIHVNLPEESSGEDGIGIDEGFEDPEFNRGEGTFTTTYTRRFDSMYHIIVTSDNPMEVVLLYHFLKAIFISIFDHVQLEGLENPKLSGQDLSMYSEIVPTNVFIRGVGLSFSYEISVPNAFSKDQIKNICFTATKINSAYNI